MPSELILQLRQEFNDRLLQLGQKVRLERTGDEFLGILMVLPVVDPILDLGNDIREKASLESRRDLIPDIKYGDVIIQFQPLWSTVQIDTPPRWKVTQRIDNPADFAIKFWLIKIGSGDAGF